MVNRGIAPPDFDTPVGLFRAAYPDLTYVPLDPVEPGFGDYAELSDTEIEGFLALGGGSISRSIGFYYLQLSGRAALQSKSVKDYDLSVDTSKRAADLRAAAQFWFDMADEEDDLAGDNFVIVPTGTPYGYPVPELSVAQWGRTYTVGPVAPAPVVAPDGLDGGTP